MKKLHKPQPKRSFSILPESSLVRKSFTLRLIDFPPSVKKTRRSLLRFFALSTGLISEQETRTVVLPVLDSLFHFLFSLNKNPSTLDLHDFIKSSHKLNVSEKLIRYHLQKMIDLGFISRKKNMYHLNSAPDAEKNDLKALLDFWLKKDVASSFDNIQESFSLLEKSYSKT